MTAQHDIRLFLADVDGALVTQDKVLTEAAKAAASERYARADRHHGGHAE